MSIFTDNTPYEVAVQAGKSLYLCICGATKARPYCDDTHQEEPHALAHDTIDVCGCGKSKTLSWCDGSHN